MLLRITAPHFVAGVIFKDKRPVEAAPIIKYMERMTAAQIKSYLQYKNWKWEWIRG